MSKSGGSSGGKFPKIMKIVIATIYAFAPLVLLAHLIVTGGTINSFLDTLVVITAFTFIILSSYIIFGKRKVKDAVDIVEDMKAGRGDD